MTYAALTHGRTPAQMREIERILHPTEIDSPERVAAENRKAMQQLGALGQVGGPVRRKRTP